MNRGGRGAQPSHRPPRAPVSLVHTCLMFQRRSCPNQPNAPRPYLRLPPTPHHHGPDLQGHTTRRRERIEKANDWASERARGIGRWVSCEGRGVGGRSGGRSGWRGVGCRICRICRVGGVSVFLYRSSTTINKDDANLRFRPSTSTTDTNHARSGILTLLLF